MEKDSMYKLDNQFCFQVYAASRMITKMYRPLLKDLGLTYPQYLVMLVLWEVEEISVKDLGLKLYLDSGTLTPLLKRLESMGVITRQRSTEDERVLLVSLKEDGRALEHKAKELDIPGTLYKECDFSCEVEDMFQLRKQLKDLVKDLEKATSK